MKHLLFILSILITIACNDASPEEQKPRPQPPKDTVYTHIVFAYGLNTAKAKMFVRDTLLEVWEQKADDTSEAVRVRKKFYDTLYFVNIKDTIKGKDGSKRPIDTFYFINDKLVIEDLGKPWIDSTKWRADSTRGLKNAMDSFKSKSLQIDSSKAK